MTEMHKRTQELVNRLSKAYDDGILTREEVREELNNWEKANFKMDEFHANLWIEHIFDIIVG